MVIYNLYRKHIIFYFLFLCANVDGREPLNRTEYLVEDLNKIYTYMNNGHYKPDNCTPVQKVAIVVPYRNREKQLRIFLNNVIPKIYRQQLEFGIYIIDQVMFNHNKIGGFS